MKNFIVQRCIGIALLASMGACSVHERSRDLGDASVSSSTLAQQVCADCHGARGVSTSPNFPNLAAQTEPYLVSQLTEYRGHSRSDPEGFEYMWGLSAHLTDGQIKGLAQYFSQLPPSTGNVDRVGTPKMLAEGKIVFEQGIVATGVPACVTCHGAHAEGMASFPRLAGQHADYLVKQLRVFQNTDQRPDAAPMKVVTHGLSAENISNVAAYLETLPGR